MIRASELSLPPTLLGWIEEIWRLQGHGAERVEPVFPDLAAAELVLCLGDPGRFLHPSGELVQPPRLVVGALSGPLPFVMPDDTHILGVRLPVACACLLGRRPSELRDRMIPLDRVVPELDRSLATWMRGRATDAQLLDRLAAHASTLVHRCDPRVREVADALARDPAACTIHELAAQVGCSRRQLARDFASELGISARSFAQRSRFANAWQQLALAPPRDWTSAAVELGYCDQSHMIREFRRLGGDRPSRLFYPTWYSEVVYEVSPRSKRPPRSARTLRA